MFKHGFPPEWSTIKKLIWIVGSGIAGAAAGVWKTVSGSLIHITDALASPMQKCEVTLEPIQDLHGQDAPYPAGGGKNLVDQPAILNVGATIADDGSYHVNLAGSLANVIVFQNDGTAGQFAITFISKNTGTSRGVYPVIKYTDGTLEALSVTGHTSYETVTKVTQSAKTVDYVSLTYGSNVETWFYIQVEKGNTPTDWSPYSNICPITGWTGCEVTRTGKNLFDQSLTATMVDCYGAAGTAQNRLGYILNVPAGEYAISLTRKEAGGAYIYGNILNFDGSFSSFFYLCANDTITNKVATLSEGQYFVIYDGQATTEQSTDKSKWFNIQCEHSSTVTEFEPYSGTTLSVTFPDSVGTVYGGTVDLVSGVLTVDKVFATISDFTWTAPNDQYSTFRAVTPGLKAVSNKANVISSAYKATTWDAIGVNDNNCIYGRTMSNNATINIKDTSQASKTAAQFEADNANVQIVYELATPTEISLTPQEISTLKGENNVWSNTNGETTLIYKAQAE
jgi:hypothetical protein